MAVPIWSYLHQERRIWLTGSGARNCNCPRDVREGSTTPPALVDELVGLGGEDVSREIPQNGHSWGKDCVKKASATRMCRSLCLLQWSGLRKLPHESRRQRPETYLPGHGTKPLPLGWALPGRMRSLSPEQMPEQPTGLAAKTHWEHPNGLSNGWSLPRQVHFIRMYSLRLKSMFQVQQTRSPAPLSHHAPRRNREALWTRV